MPAPAPGWGVNPLALAQLMRGQLLPKREWAAVEKLLQDAFHVNEVRHLFEAEGGKAPRLAIFEALAKPRGGALAYRDIENLEEVKQAISVYGEYQDEAAVRRILPILLPVADAVFTASEDPAAAAGVLVPDYYVPFMENVAGDVSWLDPVQGNADDCYLIAALIALAWSRPEQWSEQVRGFEDRGNATARYRFAFHNRAGAIDALRVEPRVPKFKDVPVYGRCTDKNEGWVAMIEKAYVMWRSKRPDREPLPIDYRLISEQPVLPQDACSALVGGHGKKVGPYRPKPLAAVAARCDERGVTRDPTMAWTWQTAAWQSLDKLKALGFARTGLVPNHAYAVLGVVPAKNPDYVVLRNPWGSAPFCTEGHATGTWRPGPGANGAAEVALNVNGVSALKASWFDDCFEKVGWVAS